MKISIPTDKGMVSAHFGRCHSFIIVDIENGNIIKKETMPNPGHEPGAIPQFLHKQGVEYIICGGIGQMAIGFFNKFGVQVIAGISGTVDDTIQELLNGTLKGGESLCEHDKK